MIRKTLLIALMLIVSISLGACETSNNGTDKQESQIESTNESNSGIVEEDSKEDSETEKKKEKPKEDKVYEIGEEAIFRDEDGKDMYSLRIDEVKSANKFIEENNENYSINGRIGIFQGEYEQAVEIIYTYTNIAKDDEAMLYIMPEDFQVADMKGSLGEPTVTPLKTNPQVLIPNTNVTVEGHYALKNKSDKVKIIFKSEMYNQTVVFESKVTE